MASTVDVLVRGHGSTDQLVRCVGNIIGHPLSRVEDVEWTLYQTTSVGLEMSVYDQPEFCDDLGLRLSQYEAVISSKRALTGVDPQLQAEWGRVFGLVLGALVSRQLSCECLVLDDMQVVLGKFGGE